MINWSEVKHFKQEEFTCKCGCGFNNINDELVLLLDIARGLAKVPFSINSAYRCEKHNRLLS